MTITQELSLFLGHSLTEMRDLKQAGRITDRLYRHYLTLWQWGAWRDNYLQQRYWDRMGPAVYWRRIERTKLLIERIRAVEKPLTHS